MLLYSCAVALMAVSTSIVVINIGLAEHERVLITLLGLMLFLLGIYGAWTWSQRRQAAAGEARSTGA